MLPLKFILVEACSLSRRFGVLAAVGVVVVVVEVIGVVVVVVLLPAVSFVMVLSSTLNPKS